MNKLTEEELYQFVSKLTPRFQVAFATRLAASVLVFLEFEGELIHYCPRDERRRFLLELLRAVQSAYLYILTGKIPPIYLEKIRHSIANIYRYASAYSNSIIKNRNYRKLERMPRHHFVLKWFPIKFNENSRVKDARVANVILILYATVDAAITSNTIISNDSKQNNISINRRLRQAINQVVSATVKLNLNSISLIKLLVLHKKDIFCYLRRPLFFTEQNDYINSGNIIIDLGLQSNFLSVLRNFGQGFDWWADWYQDRLNGKQIGIVLWEKTTLLPESLLEQTPEVVNAYLKSLTDGKATFPLNRVRVFFIGDGAAGKTSLIRALHGERVVAGMEPMTPGVEIREWDVPDTEIKAHLWDFGGQVIAHAMHKFFLRESCVYVLVQEARPGSNANERTEYWLEHVQRFGHCAPVLLVGNKADQTQLNLDLRSLREHYSNIVGFFSLSCTEFMGAFKQHFTPVSLQ